MVKVTFSTKGSQVKSQEAIDLYLAVGWGEAKDYTKGDMKKALGQSDLVISARNSSGELVGLARVLSDDVYHSVLTDILVHPRYQRKGIGAKMMKIVQKKYGNTPLYVDTFSEEKRFFEKFDLKERNMTVLSWKSSEA